LISDLWGNQLLLSKPPSLWSFLLQSQEANAGIACSMKATFNLTSDLLKGFSIFTSLESFGGL
jgi:hypothetical protein